jgi:hypothetical protein
LDVLCDRPQDAMGEIEKLAGVKEVALFGRALHVVADEGSAVAQTIRRMLPPAGYALHRVEAIRPSLEDVFVSLIEARDRVARNGQARDVQARDGQAPDGLARDGQGRDRPEAPQ